jgi:hypothetical protein
MFSWLYCDDDFVPSPCRRSCASSPLLDAQGTGENCICATVLICCYSQTCYFQISITVRCVDVSILLYLYQLVSHIAVQRAAVT